MDTILLIGFIFLLLFIYGIFSNQLNKWSISGPMVFTILGLLTFGLAGSSGLEIEGDSLGLIGQVALIAILFTDASNLTLKEFFKVYRKPVKLLFIGLPLTMILGLITAKMVFPEINLFALAVMAFILSPTDAALGQAVVQSPKVPLQIRESINVESGLNDGLVLPPILICAALVQGMSAQIGGDSIGLYISKQILIGPAIGIVLGWGCSKIVNWSVKKMLSDQLFQGICIIAISIVTYVIAEQLGGNGYIAAFTSGLFFNADSKKVLKTGQEFGEFLSQPLSLFVFFCFGLSILPHYAQHIDGRVILYAILSLTVLRMLPVIISLTGEKLKMREKVFIAWFGPRGIASILYFLLLYDQLPKTESNDTLYATIVLTVVLCVFLHGLTAVPYANWLGKKSK